MIQIISNRKKQSCISIIVGFVLCFSVIIIISNAKSLDNIVLLEKRNPSYWDILNNKVELCLQENYKDPAATINYFRESSWMLANYDGIDVKRYNNGIISIAGENSGKDAYYHITDPETFKLKSGNYYISVDSEGFNDICLFFEAYSNDKKYILATVPQGNSTFTFDESLYDSYDLCLCVKNGFSSEKTIEIYPSIYKQGDKPINGAYTYNVGGIGTAIIYDIENVSLDDSDIKILKNTIEVQNNNYFWTSVITEKGKGIQFCNDQYHFGEMDSLGRVIKELNVQGTEQEKQSIISELINYE